MAAAVALESLDAPLIDSHCHIVFRNFDDDLEEVAQRWRDAGVGRLLHACVEPSEIPAIRALADRFPELRYAVGVHPLTTTSRLPTPVPKRGISWLCSSTAKIRQPYPRILSNNKPGSTSNSAMAGNAPLAHQTNRCC